MGLAVALLIIFGMIALVILAMLITGIIFVIVGSRRKKQGKKGTIAKVGIGLLVVPLLLLLTGGGVAIWRQIKVKCVADEWRYFSLNAGEGTAPRDMLRSLLGYIEDDDRETFCREFTQELREDKHFDDTVDDFFDDLDDLDVELDADDFLADLGDSVFFDYDHSNGKYRYDRGYVYTAEIDGENYYIYERICTRNDQHRDEIGLEQLIICTEDKVDELYEMIENRDDDIYLAVL